MTKDYIDLLNNISVIGYHHSLSNPYDFMHAEYWDNKIENDQYDRKEYFELRPDVYEAAIVAINNGSLVLDNGIVLFVNPEWQLGLMIKDNTIDFFFMGLYYSAFSNGNYGDVKDTFPKFISFLEKFGFIKYSAGHK